MSLIRISLNSQIFAIYFSEKIQGFIKLDNGIGIVILG